MCTQISQHLLGAVELPLTCAQLLDPDNIGLDSWNAGLPVGDPRTEFAEKRLLCYDLVMDSLTIFETKCAIVRTETDAESSADDPEAVRSHAYELAFASEDEIFHSTLYDWLIGRGLADDLLEVCVAYRIRYAVDNTAVLDAARIP